MSIVSVDLANEYHRKIILKLSKRNKFYQDDIYMTIYNDFPKEIKNRVMSMVGENIYSEIKSSIDDDLNKFTNLGFLITNKNSNDKISVVGFLLFNLENKLNSNLTFLLIDKLYVKKGFGSELMHSYVKFIEDNNLIFAVVKVENSNVKSFYKKFGFISMKTDEVEKLYYIPKKIKSYFNYSN